MKTFTAAFKDGFIDGFTMGPIRRFIWKIRFSFIIRRDALMSLNQGFRVAGAWIESFGTEMTPQEAVDEELSNWTNDEEQS